MFKRDLKLFLNSLVAMIITCAVLALGCIALFLGAHSASENSGFKIKAAVSNPYMDNALTTIFINMALSSETISKIVEAHVVGTDEEAFALLESGEAEIVVIVPDNIYQNGMVIGDATIKIIMDYTDPTILKFVEYYFETASTMLTTTEYIIFSGDALAAESGISAEAAKAFNEYMNSTLLYAVLDAKDTYFTTTIIPYTSSGLSTLDHYALLYFSFFLTLLSVSLYKLYRTDLKRSRLQLIRGAGIGKLRFIFWKVVLLLIVYILFTALLCFFVRNILNVTVSFESVLCAILALIFASFFCAAFAMGLSRAYGAVIIALSLISLFLLGGIIPYPQLNETIRSLGAYTPVGVFYYLLAPLLGGTVSAASFLALAVYAALGIILYNNAFKMTITGGAET